MMAILPHLTLSWDGLTARLVSAVPPDRLTSGCPPTSLAPPSRACWSDLAGRRWPVGHGRPTGPPVTGPGHLSAPSGDTFPVMDTSTNRFNPISAGLWPFTAIEPPPLQGAEPCLLRRPARRRGWGVCLTLVSKLPKPPCL